jgi:hypothetical protein
LAIMIAASGCADDVPEPPRADKGVVDEAALAGGVVVVLDAQTGQLTVPFVEPVPATEGGTGGNGDEFEDQLSGAVSLVVSSDVSGTTANLVSGILVDSAPTAAGQWTWSFNEANDAAALTFFNQTTAGLTLDPANTYSATLGVGTNDYVENVSPLVFTVTVVEN